jgi:putative FmdB family regulatory protein
MPRYSYKCTSCEAEIDISHPYKQTKTDCPACEKANTLTRVIGRVNIQYKKDPNPSSSPGSIVVDNIEENRSILKNTKRDFGKRIFKK